MPERGSVLSGVRRSGNLLFHSSGVLSLTLDLPTYATFSLPWARRFGGQTTLARPKHALFLYHPGLNDRERLLYRRICVVSFLIPE
jgi:hypothetical protein